jgi:hypothetical protein
MQIVTGLIVLKRVLFAWLPNTFTLLATDKHDTNRRAAEIKFYLTKTTPLPKQNGNVIRRGAGKSLAFPIFLFVVKPKEFFLDRLKKLEQRSHKCVALRGNM